MTRAALTIAVLLASLAYADGEPSAPRRHSAPAAPTKLPALPRAMGRAGGAGGGGEGTGAAGPLRMPPLAAAKDPPVTWTTTSGMYTDQPVRKMQCKKGHVWSGTPTYWGSGDSTDSDHPRFLVCPFCLYDAVKKAAEAEEATQ